MRSRAVVRKSSRLDGAAATRMAPGDECSNVIQTLEHAPTVVYPAFLLDTPPVAFEIEDVGFGLLAQTRAGPFRSWTNERPLSWFIISEGLGHFNRKVPILPLLRIGP